MNLWKLYENGIPKHLIKAANTPSLGRLKGIGMSCGCEYTSFARFQNCPSYNRFDHSMGVALIIWHFTKNIQQSFAGLLHDIATPVFSHVVDFLYKDHLKQEYTESNTRNIILSDEKLLSVLEKYGFLAEDVDDYHKFSIADNDAPQLSADRLEYTLGNLIHYGIRDKKIVASYYENIIVGNNEKGALEIMFKDDKIAGAFARDAILCARVYTCDEDRYAMQKLANILHSALCDGVICQSDLYKTETYLIQKLKANEKYKKLWQTYRSYSKVISSKTKPAGDEWLFVNAKKRYIDPLVLEKGRTSLLSSEFKKELDLYIKESFDYWICGVTN